MNELNMTRDLKKATRVSEGAYGEDWPSIDDLPREDVLKLRKLKDIKNVKVTDEWYDDHQLAFGVEFKDQDNNSYKISLWWVGPSVMASAEYANKDANAKRKFIKHIKSYAKDTVGDGN